MSRYLSGRSKLTPQSGLQSDRYRYLSIENAEPNLGDPLVGPSSVTAKPIPPGQQFIIVSVEGSTSGERYWIPNQGGIIPGSISVFDDNTLVGALSSITQLNFVGAAITASVSIASSNLATVRVFSPGNSQEIIFNTANEFSTSTKLKFDPSNGLLTAGDRIIVGAGGTVITTTGVGSVGIGTTNPTQELHLQGDLRLTGTIYDYLNQPGTDTQLLVKNALGGIIWANQGTIRAGAGGTYQNIQFHNSSGLVDGALNFVFDEVNSRIGIGSTQPKVLLDVLGISSFKGGTTIDNLNVTGISTIRTLGVTGTTTTRNFQSTGISTLADVDINAGEIDVTRIETQNLKVIGVTTVGFVTGTDAYFTGIVTARKFVGEVNVSNLYVTGVSTFLQKVNINSNLGVTGLTTTENLQVYQSTTLNRLKVSGISTFDTQVNIDNLNVTGVGTFDNIKLDSNTISTNDGNLVLDSSAGTTQINDAIYVNDSTESTSKDGGSIVTEGGVGIEKNLNVGGQLNVGGATTLASAGGITTTGGDLYVKGDLYVSDDIFYDELFARNGYFTGITSTKDLNVTGVATIATLGVTGLTTTRNLNVTGIATIATLGVTGLTTTKDLLVTGISTFQGNVTIGDDANVDTVTFTSKINSNVLPSTNASTAVDVNGKDLGGTSNYWRKVYAREFNGQFIGNADTASQVSTGTTTGITTYYPTFVDSNNSIRGDEFLYTDAGISYNPSTDLLTAGNLGVTGLTTTRNLRVIGVGTFDGLLDANAGATIDNIQIGISGDNEIDTSTGNLILDSFGGTVEITDQLIVSGISTFNGNVTLGDATSDIVTFTARVNSSVLPFTNGTLDLGGTSNRWSTIYANTFNGSFVGNADTATKLTNARNFSITGDVDAPAVSFDGTGNVILDTTLDNTGVTAGTYGSSTQVGIVTVDAKGRITSASNVGINFSTATVAQSDTIKTVTSSATILYPTFVDSDNNPAAYEALYTDAGIAYNASTNLLTIGGSLNLSSTTASTATAILTRGADNNFQLTAQNGTATNAVGQEVSRFGINYSGSGWNTFLQFIRGGGAIDGSLAIYTNNTARLLLDSSGNLLPQGTSGTLDLGGVSNKWDNVYANTFVGAITGNADTATYATNAGISTNLKGGIASQIPYQTAANTTAFIPNGTSGQLLQSNGTSAPSWVTATDLTVAKADYADNAGIATNLKGGIAGSIPYQTAANTTTFLVEPNVNGRILTWNNTTNAPIWSDPSSISVGTASSLSVTVDTANLNRNIVLSSTSSGISTVLADTNLLYNPSTYLLTLPNIRPTAIQDTGGGTGTDNFVLTANGSGGWTWKQASTSGGSAAIAGITIQEEGSPVGTQLGITTVNFIGASVTATSPSAGTANITVTAVANILVNQTGYGCANPITVTGGNTIGIGSTSNAYGRKFVSTTEPTGVCDGDIWYDASGSTPDSGATLAGTVIYYAASAAPTGYIKANGASLSTTTYASLFAAIGYTFGGSGSVFTIPDLRGQFIRSWVDNGTVYDVGRTFGSSQADAHQNHTHSYTASNSDNVATYLWEGGSGIYQTMNSGTFGATTGSATGNTATETRPRNIALLACIKY